MSRRGCWRGISPARDARYAGSVVSTNLKVSGVSVFSAGDFMGAEGSEQIVLSDVRRGTYKKLVISEESSPARCWSAIPATRCGTSN